MVKPIRPFKSDGCTMSPDGVWYECCKKHDKDYWMGGTREERLASDKRLKKCIDEMIVDVGWPFQRTATGRFFGRQISPWLTDEEIAQIISRIYYRGVRIGGVGWLPLRHARWGWGHPYPRTGP